MNPAGPVDPGSPLEPGCPTCPAGPLKPASPVFPLAPTGPRCPLAPTKPSVPVAPVGPCGPLGPRSPRRPLSPATPMLPGQFTHVQCRATHQRHSHKITSNKCTTLIHHRRMSVIHSWQKSNAKQNAVGDGRLLSRCRHMVIWTKHMRRLWFNSIQLQTYIAPYVESESEALCGDD